jgi:chromosome transmission fidelity protein 8
MLIHITTQPSSNLKLPPGLVKISNDEIVLIELQGSLEVELNHPSERNGRPVGTLKIDEATNKPSLLIGHHLLEGKVASLPKPYAILLRTGSTCATISDNDTSNDDDDMVIDSVGPDHVDVEDSSLQKGSRAGWAIVGVVKKKIIFSKRPMPVIGKKLGF